MDFMSTRTSFENKQKKMPGNHKMNKSFFFPFA